MAFNHMQTAHANLSIKHRYYCCNLDQSEASCSRKFKQQGKFYHEIFILEQNSRNHENFLSQKFEAIQYIAPNNIFVIFITTYTVTIKIVFI